MIRPSGSRREKWPYWPVGPLVSVSITRRSRNAPSCLDGAHVSLPARPRSAEASAA